MFLFKLPVIEELEKPNSIHMFLYGTSSTEFLLLHENNNTIDVINKDSYIYAYLFGAIGNLRLLYFCNNYNVG